MASPRKPFAQLSESVRNRKLSYYRRNGGLSSSEVAQRYNAGTLGSQKAARGKAKGPEHPRDALKKSYPGYKPKKEIRVTKAEKADLYTSAVQAMDNALSGRTDLAGPYSPEVVRDNVGEMTAKELLWTINATVDQIRGAARMPKGSKSKWFYHA